MPSRQLLTKTRSGGGKLLLRRKTPHKRPSVAYFHSGTHTGYPVARKDPGIIHTEYVPQERSLRGGIRQTKHAAARPVQGGTAFECDFGSSQPVGQCDSLSSPISAGVKRQEKSNSTIPAAILMESKPFAEARERAVNCWDRFEATRAAYADSRSCSPRRPFRYPANIASAAEIGRGCGSCLVFLVLPARRPPPVT